MRLRRMASSLVVGVAAVALSCAIAAPALAAPAAHLAVSATAARLLPNTSLRNKIVLPDTSIDGPALTSLGNQTALAWTGTDAEHHLNVETSLDGLHYEHKLTLNETSPFRPDVAAVAVQASFVVSVAWTGSDANHSLNVLFDVYGSSPKKLTLRNENSFTAPALFSGTCLTPPALLCLAWTGTDAHHSLNILQLTVTAAGLVPLAKTTLTQDSSDAGPHLAQTSASALALLWSAGGTQQLRVATGTQADALEPGTAVDGELSAAAPDAYALGPSLDQGNRSWLGWTGTDEAHHLNLQSTTSFPNFTNPENTKTTLVDTAIGGPALSFNTGLNENLLAWTGTDAAHHLNVASFV